jgi:hypothetical protein
MGSKIYKHSRMLISIALEKIVKITIESSLRGKPMQKALTTANGTKHSN